MSGKATAAQNARKHGLSARAAGWGGREIKTALLAEMGVESLSAESRLLAGLVVDAQVALAEVAGVVALHVQELEMGLKDEELRMLERLVRYERRAQARLRNAIRLFDRA